MGDKKQYDVKLVHAKYDELLEQLQQGRIDALSVSTYNEAKLSNLSYSIPYIEIKLLLTDVLARVMEETALD